MANRRFPGRDNRLTRDGLRGDARRALRRTQNVKVFMMTVDEAVFRSVIDDRDQFWAVRDRLLSHDRKKFDERVALEKIYRGQNLAAVEWCERPDFIVRRDGHRLPFGVEICRYFDSQSEARLREVPGYSRHLLSGGPVRHKDDIAGFSVTSVAIQDAEGTTIAASEPAIMRRMPPVSAVVDGVRALIADKEKLFPIDQELSHVNLVIDERTGILATTDAAECYRVFGTRAFNEVIFRSTFREIFMITRFKSGAAFVPLKMLFSLARLYFFHEAFVASRPDESVGMRDYMTSFAQYLRSLTRQVVGVRSEGETAEVLYGDTGLIVAEAQEGVQTIVRSYRDAEWPVFTPAQFTSSARATALCERVEQMLTESTFVSPIAFPVTVPLSD